MGLKKDNTKIMENIKKLENNHNFVGLLHFTDYSNLKSIFSSGYLSSREYCNNNDIQFLNGADDTVIGKTKKLVKECVRFYYEEDSYTLYRNEGIKINNAKPHLPIPVYLLFDKELILQEDAVYSDGCAGSKYSSFGNDYRFFENIQWDTVFSRGSIPYELPDYQRYEIKRIRQAELLMKSPVGLKYLRKVIFRSKCDYRRAINDFGESNLFEINRKMFNCKNNFVRDHEVIYNEFINSVEVKIRLNKYDFMNYKYSYEVIDTKGKDVETTYKIVTENPDKQAFSFLIENYSENWSILKFYINDIMCVEENIEKLENK